MTIIKELSLGGQMNVFLDVASHIYQKDKAYVRPLDMELKERLNPKKNPFFLHGEAAFFVAYREGKCVGRISASIDHEHLKRYGDSTGFFGFFDTIFDQEVAEKLMYAAEKWLRSRGLKRLFGPLSLNINEEAGCLVEGFHEPPYMMMPHHLPYQCQLIEACGYKKVKDLLAWKYVVGDLNARTKRAREEILAMPEVNIRPMSMKNLQSDVASCVDIFNDAWSENWGFVPLTEKEAQKMAVDFKLMLEPEITRIVTIDNEPAAFAIAIPNLNEIISDLDGKLFPFGAFKIFYRLKVLGAKSARLALLGIRKKIRKNRKYAPLSLCLFAEMNDSGRRLGMREGELSWTLEDNAAINVGIKMMGAEVYKKYRLYEKNLAT